MMTKQASYDDMESLCLVYEDWQKDFRKGYAEPVNMAPLAEKYGTTEGDFLEFYNSWRYVHMLDIPGWCLWGEWGHW